MIIKFILRPHSLPRSFPRPIAFCILSGNSTKTVTLCSAFENQSIPYGPSLRKGQNPFHSYSIISSNAKSFPLVEKEENDNNLFNEESFTRVFSISALRVPAEYCFVLESQLRGHLLNWPRIRNIARVPGDEIDEELKKLFDNRCSSSDNSDNDSEDLVALNRRMYGKAEGDGEPLDPVLYRDKLARTFNSKGFVKFRNLAKLSRPRKRKKKKEVEKEGRKEHGIGKNEMALVEVVGEDEESGVSGLLGDAFRGSRWRGSTRLLLLDERYADKGIDDLPEAIKVLFYCSLAFYELLYDLGLEI